MVNLIRHLEETEDANGSLLIIWKSQSVRN